MSTYKTLDAVIREIEYWIRLSTLLHSGIHQALLAVLHNDSNDPAYIGLPRNPRDLFKELNTTHKVKLTQLRNKKNKRILSDEQWDKLFPQSRETFSENLDVTLLCILIINCTTLTPPVTGWDYKKLPANDTSKAAGVLRCREWRNYLHHTDPLEISHVIFQGKWREGENIIKTLGYQFDSIGLKSISLDPKTSQQQHLLLKVLNEFCKKEVKEHTKCIQDNTSNINVHDVKIKEHDKTIKEHCDLFKEHADRIKEMENLILICKEKLETQKIRGITIEDNYENKDMKNLNAVIHIPYGCIFKTQLNSGYVIETVKIKCISQPSKKHSDWLVVDQKIERNDDATDYKRTAACYEVKEMDETHVLLKIEHLEEFKKYQILLQTNKGLLQGEVTICDHSTSTHITTIKDAFIVFSPVLGQPNDPRHCHNGLQGYFVDEKNTPTLKVSTGVTVKQMTFREFIDFCQDYFHRNFPDVLEVLQFPPNDQISDPVVKKVASVFMELLSSRQEFRAVLTNLDSKKYIRCFLTNTYKVLDATADLTFHNRIMVFDQSTECILNIRVVQGANFNYQTYKEMEKAVLDLQYFVSAHRHHLCCCYVISILAFPNVERSKIISEMCFYYTKTDQSLLNLFYLSKEDLEDSYHLQEWWNETLENCLQQGASCKEESSTIESFQQICAQSVAAIAIAEVSAKLPTLSPDPYLQIQSLLLNPAQLKAITSTSMRKTVIGSYGTGKSVVLDEITKRKFQECQLKPSKDRILLISVVWECYSLLEFQKQCLLKTLRDNDKTNCPQNVITMCGNVQSLWQDIGKKDQVTLLKFLQHFLKNSSYKEVHMVIDELPSNSVHHTEVKRINHLLQAHPTSSITIAPQSVIIDRRTSAKKWEKNHDQNCLSQLELDRFELTKVMRNTKQVTSVLKASKDQLHNTETVLSVYDAASETMGKLKKFQKKLRKRFGSSVGIVQEKSNNQQAEMGDEISQLVDDEPQLSFISPMEFGKISKFMELENNQQKKAPTLHIKTTYNFHPIENGNGVEDRKPVLIKLPEEVDLKSEVSAKILTLTLRELCSLKRKAQTLILCSSIQEVVFISYCLSLIPNFKFVVYIPQLQGYIPSEDERLSIYKAFTNGGCLLTDNTGIKGMEAKRVLIVSEYHEYYEKHVINETLSRANVWAYIILHSPVTIYKKERETLCNVLERLGDELLQVENVILYEDKSNFNQEFSREDKKFKINNVCPLRLNNRSTFKEYQISFLDQHPIKQTEKSLRNSFMEQISLQKYEIIREIQTHNGEIFNFHDIYHLLRESKFDVFQKLLEIHPNLVNNLRDESSDNRTLLMHACLSSNQDVVDYLLQEFSDVIDVMVTGEGGWVAFHCAAETGDVEIMRSLLEFDRSGLNIVKMFGSTPLHDAAINNQQNMVEFLLSEGCDVDIRNIFGETADQVQDASPEIKEIILAHRKNINSPRDVYTQQ